MARKRLKTPWNPKKEQLFSDLSEIIENHGVTVRREQLKAGPGFRVRSGSCRMEGDKFLFIDRFLPQDDQLLLLIAKLKSLGLEDEAAVALTKMGAGKSTSEKGSAAPAQSGTL